MKLTWDKNSSAYAAASKAIFKKYKDINESIVVQLKEKHREEDKWNDGLYVQPKEFFFCK